MSPLIALFFSETRADAMIKVVSVVLIFRGLTNIGVVLYQKELEFKKRFILDLSKILPDFIISILLLIILQNIWALIIGTIVGEFSVFIISFLIHPFKPKIELNKEKISEVLNFSLWILISNILVFLITQGDDIFVGKYLGIISLGYYQLAYNIGNLGSTEIANVFTRITFPTYSKLQNNISQLKSAFKITLVANAFISFLINGIIIVFSQDFIILFLGYKWLPILGALIFLACWGTIRSLAACMSPVFYSLNNPKIVAKFQILLLILIFVLIFPFTYFFDILGTALVIFLSGLIVFIFRVKKLMKFIKIKSSVILKIILLPFTIFLSSSLLFLFIKSFLIINIINFTITLIFYILIYIVLSFIADKFFNLNLFRFLILIMRRK